MGLVSGRGTGAVVLCPVLLYGGVFCKKKRLFSSNLRSHWSYFVIHRSSCYKVTSVSQQKMTLFFWSRSSSSFVALNATSGWLGFCPREKWRVWWFVVAFRDGGIKWLQWVSKRWHSSFEVDHHHLSSRWMRPQLAKFLSAWKMICGFFSGPEVWIRCLCSPRMESKPKLLALAGQDVPLIGVLTGCTTSGQSGSGCNEGKG